MDLASVINTMFSNFNQQFLEPIASGLWGIIPNTAVIAVIAAILTPPDAVSQCMLAIPMALLYEVAAQLARLVKPQKPAET